MGVFVGGAQGILMRTGYALGSVVFGWCSPVDRDAYWVRIGFFSFMCMNERQWLLGA